MLEVGRRTGRFRPADRLLDSRDFRRVLRKGRRRSGPDLVVVVASRPTAGPTEPGLESKNARKNGELRENSRNRLGITVSRKVGNAVCRNRFKRRVRTWFREHRAELGVGLDLVVIARKSGGRLGARQLDESLSDLLGLGTPAR